MSERKLSAGERRAFEYVIEIETRQAEFSQKMAEYCADQGNYTGAALRQHEAKVRREIVEDTKLILNGRPWRESLARTRNGGDAK